MLLFLNKGIYRDKYEDEYVPWNKKTREEKALLIMRYVDSIELEQIKNEIFVKNVNFRESISKPCNELYSNGYIDRKEQCFFVNLMGTIRCSQYLNEEEAAQVIMRLKSYYKVKYKEANYYVKDKVMFFDFLSNNSAIVRVFPLEDYTNNLNTEIERMGIIYINGDDIEVLEDEKDIDKLFKYIPDDSTEAYNPNMSLKDVPVKPIRIEFLKDIPQKDSKE